MSVLPPEVRSHVVPHPRSRSQGWLQPAYPASDQSRPPALQEPVAQHGQARWTAGAHGAASWAKAAAGVVQLESDANGRHQAVQQAATQAPLTAPLQRHFCMRHSQQQYEANVASCLEELRAGNSYELCLTTAFERQGLPAINPYALYVTLRRVNPAPHAALLRFAGPTPVSVRPSPAVSADLTLLSACTPSKGLHVRLDITSHSPSSTLANFTAATQA